MPNNAKYAVYKIFNGKKYLILFISKHQQMQLQKVLPNNSFPADKALVTNYLKY